MTTIHGDYVGNTLIFSPYIAHIFSVPHKETSTGGAAPNFGSFRTPFLPTIWLHGKRRFEFIRVFLRARAHGSGSRVEGGKKSRYRASAPIEIPLISRVSAAPVAHYANTPFMGGQP